MKRVAHNKIYWTNKEIDLLNSDYKIKTNEELSIELNKSKRTVSRKLKELGLVRTKVDIDYLRSKIIKLNGRDLNLDNLIKIAKKYDTKHEFYLNDGGAYSAAIKNGWIDLISKHMVLKNVSIPQLMMRDILEYILKTKCSYNDRSVIKPLEIDCYFSKWKIGWEYDGKYYHEDYKDKIKNEKCELKKIHLFRINEKSKIYRNYEVNIKNQILKQLPAIKLLTNININKNDLLGYKPKINYPNKLTLSEIKMVSGKKMSEIKKLDIKLYNRIKKYELFNTLEFNIINDVKKYNKHKNIEDYLKYLNEKKYDNFKELCKYEHPHRLIKKWGEDIKIIHDLYE